MEGNYSAPVVIRFSNNIGRDPGTVAGRSFNNRKDYGNTEMKALRSKYRGASG